MNSHQRRKARRRYEHRLNLKRVPLPLLEMAADVPGGLDQARELCEALGIRAALCTFKLDLDGVLEVVPYQHARSHFGLYHDRIKVEALDYLKWRRDRQEAT